MCILVSGYTLELKMQECVKYLKLTGHKLFTAMLSSPPSSLSSLQSLSGSSSLQALRPQGPNLTPSLANFYRDDLVNHVRGMPAEIVEKQVKPAFLTDEVGSLKLVLIQAQKLNDEAYILGSLHCTKVSAELKMARSRVRQTEIQATLQEQRSVFLIFLVSTFAPHTNFNLNCFQNFVSSPANQEFGGVEVTELIHVGLLVGATVERKCV
jgi:hypothetical protein